MRRFALTCILALSLRAQEFDVASIRSPSPNARAQCNGGPGTGDPRRLTCQNFPLSYFVMMAYDLRAFQFQGPDWMLSSRFDLQATIPSGAAVEQFQSMLRTLLVSRFRLAVHTAKKEMDSYDLVVSKPNPNLKKSEDQTPSPGAPFWRPPVGGPPRQATAQLSCTKCSMARLATLVSDRIDHPVKDATSLQGLYDFKLTYTDNPAGAGGLSVDDDSAIDIESALKDQLGLALIKKKLQVDVVIVDHAEKTPAED